MKRDHSPSLRQIAELAGVHCSTVSRALRKSPNLPAETVARIEKIAREAGYRRDSKLSRVMSETVGSRYRNALETIACVATRPTALESWLSPPFRAMKERALEYGYDVERFCLLEPGMSAERANQILWTRGTAGLVVLSPPSNMRVNGILTLPIHWDKFCVVRIDDAITEPILSGVRHNHLAGIWTAIQEMETLGYRRIGLCLDSEVDIDTHHRWTAGYVYWRQLRGLANNLNPLICPAYSGNEIKEWIRRQRIDAVISPAVQALEWMRACGIKVPQDVGFGSLDLHVPGIEDMAGIDQQREILWTSAVDMLVTIMHRGARGVPENPSMWTNAGKWQSGATCLNRKAPPLTPIDPGLICWTKRESKRPWNLQVGGSGRTRSA